MLIGNGMLAKKFDSYKLNDKIVIFASGVSNSNETSIDAFKREELLLNETIKNLDNCALVYFSTCSMYDTYFEQKEYTHHKIKIENMIINSKINYLICRLPQVIGDNNKSQLMGFLYEKIQTNEKFTLFDIERNIIDIDDVKTIVDFILDSKIFMNKIINIANPTNVKVRDLVRYIEISCNKKADYTIVQKQGHFNINISNLEDIYSNLNLFSKDYIERKVKKYFG